MNGKKRIIFHVDMDHFYTAVEERLRPELKDKPVIVGADPIGGMGRGVVSTSNYEARKFGVRSGMPISQAWKLCPQGVYLPVDMPLYVKVSDRIMMVLREYGGKFEQWGIDEAFLDVTSRVDGYAEAEILARQLKKQIVMREGLTCSVGVSYNKLIAKIASEMQKPDGLTIVKEQNAEEFLASLPVRRLLWVGKKTEAALGAMGIATIGDLASHDPSELAEAFGVMGNQLYLMAHGIDNSEVQERIEIKSIGRDTTFQEDTDDFDFVLKTLDDLAEDVYVQVSRNQYYFKTVAIRIRYENFETHTHARTLSFATDRFLDLTKTARELMRPYLRPDRKIRLIGVRASNLVSVSNQKKLA
jgi:DNA polymerase IV (DinB-like DNA polymerase)